MMSYPSLRSPLLTVRLMLIGPCDPTASRPRPPRSLELVEEADDASHVRRWGSFLGSLSAERDEPGPDRRVLQVANCLHDPGGVRRRDEDGGVSELFP